MGSNNSDENTECENITAVELQISKRTLYFSDGTLEELSESDSDDIEPDITEGNTDISINLTILPLGLRIKYQAYEILASILNGAEYLGESLASFFGITDSKYVSESDIEHAMIDARSKYGNGFNNNNMNISKTVTF